VLAETVGERGGGRLVEEAHDVEAGEAAGFLRRLALGVGEVGGHRDHRLADALAELAFGAALEMAEHLRRDLGNREPAVVRDDDRLLVRTLVDAKGHAGQRELHQRRLDVLTDETLRRVHRRVRLRRATRLRLGTDDDPASRRERDDRRVYTFAGRTQRKLDTCRGCDGDHRVGGPEVDAYSK
jgi:hypothetical protein